LQIPSVVPGNADFYLQLGRRIAALRKSRGFSQERLGERARVGSSYIAHIEIGDRKPTIDVLLRIADAVNAPLWRLLTDDRFTSDEKAWDAAARDLAAKVRGLEQPDLQALSYFASRLRTAAKVASVVRHPGTSSSTSESARAAEQQASPWAQAPSRKRAKVRR
jgi:transcriptional regulator with XRE-family HTH domain